MTGYVILRRDFSEAGDDSGPNVWTEATVQHASSAAAAIRQVANSSNEGGEYVAIPSRSWKPQAVEVEQTVKLQVKPTGWTWTDE